jgi:hypothetical protein
MAADLQILPTGADFAGHSCRPARGRFLKTKENQSNRIFTTAGPGWHGPC